MKITKAVIPCAGFGIRFLPITKTIQKEMRPILNRPIIDYVVENCIKAGIKEIIFIVNEHNHQIKHFYQENKRLYDCLKKRGKIDRYNRIANLHTKAKFTFIQQKDKNAYGTAVPVLIAEEYIKDEDAFIYVLGDVFIYNQDQNSDLKAMVDLCVKNQAEAVVSCIEVEKSKLHLYGIADVKKENNLVHFNHFIEKPAPGKAPSNLSNASQYILTPKILDIIKKQKPNPKSGELYITDSVTTLAETEKVLVHIPKGKFLDGGNLPTWLKANLLIAKKNKELYRELKEFIKKEYQD